MWAFRLLPFCLVKLLNKKDFDDGHCEDSRNDYISASFLLFDLKNVVVLIHKQELESLQSTQETLKAKLSSDGFQGCCLLCF